MLASVKAILLAVLATMAMAMDVFRPTILAYAMLYHFGNRCTGFRLSPPLLVLVSSSSLLLLLSATHLGPYSPGFGENKRYFPNCLRISALAVWVDVVVVVDDNDDSAVGVDIGAVVDIDSVDIDSVALVPVP